MSDLGFFSESVDSWGAAEWFDRLAKAIREQDKAVVAGNDIGMLTYQNIAASSAMRLVRDYEANVRAALSNSGAKDREIAELTRERDEEKRRRYVLFDALGSVEKRSEGHKDWAEECARRRVDAEARWCEAALENSTLSDTISTLTSKLEEAVKALQWEFGGRVATATCPFGEYQVAEYTESDGMGYVAVFNDNDEVGEFAKSEEATLACQKHYEQRIRSALTHPAPPLAVTDEMVERLARHMWDGDRIIGWDAAVQVAAQEPNSSYHETLALFRNKARAALTAALEAKQ